MEYPKISIITPSFNQGIYLEDTILSVIGQNYPNLEYIIIDGGSTDNSIQIIKKYEKHLTFWESKKDKGQAHAINKGFAMAKGDILAWLNSDDLYLPNTLLHVSARINSKLPQLLFGNCIHILEKNPNFTRGSDLSGKIDEPDFMNGSLIQPSTFWTRKTWDAVGSLNEKMQFAFDLEWYNRVKMIDINVEFMYTQKHLSIYRFTESNKTHANKNKKKRLLEIASVYGTFRNENYENTFKYLINRLHKVRRTHNFINKINIFKRPGFYIFLFRLFFPILKSIDKDDLRIFVRRFVEGLINKKT